METCRSYATRYVGRGADRKTYEGTCVLEQGHDLDCLPGPLAMEQQYNGAYNQAVADCIALVQAHGGNLLETPLPELLGTLKRG